MTMNLWNDKHSRSTGHDGAQQGGFQVPVSVKIIDESAVSQAAMDRTPTPRPLSTFPLLLFALGRWLLLPLVLDVSPLAWWLVAHKGLVAGKADVEICDDASGNIGRCKEVRGVRTAVELFYMYYIYIYGDKMLGCGSTFTHSKPWPGSLPTTLLPWCRQQLFQK